jgi:ABC-type branched-subunit amino acid transport system substrate-binding protein
MAEQLRFRQARPFVAAIGVALLLGGCQIVPDPGAPQTRAEPPPRAPRVEAPAPVQTPAPQPALPREEARNRVAVLVPLSGPNAGIGRSLANAANLALSDSGETRIQITAYDTARGAGAAANRALAEGNRLFLGPLLAEDVRDVAPIARRSDVPVVTFSNDVSVAGNGVYLLGFVPSQSIERVVRHARGTGVQRFAALVPSGTYGQRASQALIGSVEAAGGRMVAMQTFERTPAGVRAAAVRLNAQSPYDAVLIADNARLAAAAAPALRSGTRILGPSCGARRRTCLRSGRCMAPGLRRRPRPCSISSAPATAPASAGRPIGWRAWAMTRC